MDDKKPCVRCERQIDAYARICPYCNHDQTLPPPPPQQQAASDAEYVPPQERNWRRHIAMIAGGILLLVAAFFVGALINREDTPKNAPEPVLQTDEDAAPVQRPRRSDLTLVPVDDMASLEQPITSAPIPNPAEGVPTEYQRSDATAVSSVEYAALAKRAEEERRKQQELVDPRSITTPAYAQGRRPQPPQQQAQQQTPDPMTSASAEPDVPAPTTGREPSPPAREREPARVVRSTRPVPQSQPLPSIRVSETATARLDLTIGTDGRVKQVRLRRGIPGHTPELIAAVQRWRFKPATENGVPVEAPFSVDITFNAND